MKEKALIARCRPHFLERGVEYENLAGSKYQAGLPDWTCITRDGIGFWVEFKAAARWNISVFRGRQRLVLLRWATRGFPVFVVGPGWVLDLTEFCKGDGTDMNRGWYACANPKESVTQILALLYARHSTS